MTEQIVYVDVSSIGSVEFEALERAMKGLAGFVEERVPRLISYGFYVDADRRRMTVVAVHPDSASLAFHLDVGADEFRKFAPLIDLKEIHVYGRIDPSVLDRLRRKAGSPGSGTVTVHELRAGFSRSAGHTR